MKKSL